MNSINRFITKSSALFICIGTVLVSPSASAESEWEFGISGSTISKSLDSNGWQTSAINDETLQHESGLGGGVEFKKSNWPVSVSFQLIATGDSATLGGIKEDLSILEQQIGIKKYWGEKKDMWESYIGGGIVFSQGDLKSTVSGSVTKDNDSDTGYWLGGGVNMALGYQWYAGLDVRYATSELTLGTQSQDLNGVQVGLTLGFRF